jgi:hypothetical protein
LHSTATPAIVAAAVAVAAADLAQIPQRWCEPKLASFHYFHDPHPFDSCFFTSLWLLLYRITPTMQPWTAYEISNLLGATQGLQTIHL